MQHRLVSGAALISAAMLLVAACAPQAQPAAPSTQTSAPKSAVPTATTAPVAVAKPTTAATAPAPSVAVAKPTTAAAAKVDYPQKDSVITFIVPFAAGGNSDLSTRLLAAALERDLGANFLVRNDAGSATQSGTTTVVRAKPDGSMLGHLSSGSFFASYLLPDRNAVYNLSSIIPVANHVETTQTLAVRADSPFKSAKDVLDYAKANPRKLTVAAGSPLGTAHLGTLALQREAGVEFAIVNQGGAESVLAVLGGHVEVGVVGFSNMLSQVQSGEIRVLASFGAQETHYLPGVKTLKELGYDVTSNARQGTFVPAGTPREIVEILDAVFMGALMIYGLTPGPLLFRDHADFVWTIFASMYIGNVMLLILNMPLIPMWVAVLKTPYSILFALILLFIVIGSYSLKGSMFDVGIVTLFGLIGYGCKKLDFPLAPMVLMVILGPLMETRLRSSLQISQGDFSIFVNRPISATLLAIAALVVIVSVFQLFTRAKRSIVEARGGDLE